MNDPCKRQRIYSFELTRLPLYALFQMLNLSSKVALNCTSKSVFNQVNPIFSSQICWFGMPDIISSRRYVQKAFLFLSQLHEVSFLPNVKELTIYLSTLTFKDTFDPLRGLLENCSSISSLSLSRDHSWLMINTIEFDLILPPNLHFLKMDKNIMLSEDCRHNFPKNLMELKSKTVADFFHIHSLLSQIIDLSALHTLCLKGVVERVTFPPTLTFLNVEYLGNVEKWPSRLTELRIFSTLQTCEYHLPSTLKQLTLHHTMVDVGLQSLSQNLEFLCIKDFRTQNVMLSHFVRLTTLLLASTDVTEPLSWPPTLTCLEVKSIVSTIKLPATLTKYKVHHFMPEHIKKSEDGHFSIPGLFPHSLKCLELYWESHSNVTWKFYPLTLDLCYLQNLEYVQVKNCHELILPKTVKTCIVNDKNLDLELQEDGVFKPLQTVRDNITKWNKTAGWIFIT